MVEWIYHISMDIGICCLYMSCWYLLQLTWIVRSKPVRNWLDMIYSKPRKKIARRAKKKDVGVDVSSINARYSAFLSFWEMRHGMCHGIYWLHNGIECNPWGEIHHKCYTHFCIFIYIYIQNLIGCGRSNVWWSWGRKSLGIAPSHFSWSVSQSHRSGWSTSLATTASLGL